MLKRLEEKTKIIVISNKYKNIFDNFVNNLNIKLLDIK